MTARADWGAPHSDAPISMRSSRCPHSDAFALMPAHLDARRLGALALFRVGLLMPSIFFMALTPRRRDAPMPSHACRPLCGPHGLRGPVAPDGPNGLADPHGEGRSFFISPFSKEPSQGEAPFLFVLAGEGAFSHFFSLLLYFFPFSSLSYGGEGILFFLSMEGMASLRISFSLLLFFSLYAYHNTPSAYILSHMVLVGVIARARRATPMRTRARLLLGELRTHKEYTVAYFKRTK